MNDYVCFVISPIGDPDSDIRKSADELLDYLVVPALRNCGFDSKKIVRADKLYSPGSINSDILSLIKSSDLCIIDVTGMNANVMYECGMRHGNGKPYIMLVKMGEKLPFDIAGIRTIQYDLSSLKKAKESQELLERFVNGLIETGFARDEGTDSISSIAESMRQIEQKLNTLLKGFASPITLAASSSTPLSSNIEDVLESLSPNKAFQYALTNRDVKLAEALLPRLKQTRSEESFIEFVVNPTCQLGSSLAAQFIQENWSYIISTLSVNIQYECFSAYVGFCSKTDSEAENIDFVESAFAEISKCNPSNEIRSGMHNQLSRIYYGAFITSGKKDQIFYDRALASLEAAININPEVSSYYFNKAVLLEDKDLVQAADAIERCLQLDKEDDDNHLELAYKLYVKCRRPEATEIFRRLEKVNPYLAKIAKKNT